MLSLEEIMERLLVAMAIGMLLGIEREHRDKSAGLRTITLISMGSCMFMLVSMIIDAGNTYRIASNIVTGIGFIGAGVIFKSDKGINGITTAATIWATAAVGMAVGGGLYLAALGACALILIVLALFIRIEQWIERINKERVYTITRRYEPGILLKYETLMKSFHLKFELEKRIKLDDDIQCSWRVQGSKSNQEKLVEALLEDPAIRKFEV
ncbi:MgtC/SapB family protein [Pseudobacter ginsenosidimutans]|jgi:putative Mg2+ transporter-C (MgtC) family protein|uniref:Putative Mg2+ transporter-C (MgtC) family protein n=1 Tax=Pseudobacter ginsenosidimutans TaxID=661488 RepID=A0A4Q7MBI9_9BACT|nr:MgtC/SapB family protein [Pseudobacter ginsenosidimutans]QEC42713.1 MgtC/SapB family protein [Pseudobacter ginsenosidimutans]RZS65131.1 putative Mg2+ transporter-C (MgtC) family protein [Pseudobacter ginsenosidimutans]